MTMSDEVRAAIEADNAREIVETRAVLHETLAEARSALRRARQAYNRLASDTVYDIEIAEGGDEGLALRRFIDAAFDNVTACRVLAPKADA